MLDLLDRHAGIFQAANQLQIHFRENSVPVKFFEIKGTPIDSEDAVNFSVQTDIRAMIETFSLEQVNEADEQMTNGQARFRAVIPF